MRRNTRPGLLEHSHEHTGCHAGPGLLEHSHGRSLGYGVAQEPPTMASTDRDALIVLYRSTDGPSWSLGINWDTDAHVSEWYGVEVNYQGRVVTLSLPSNILRGCIPKELGALTELEKLDLTNNQLTGPIPKELGALSELKQLFLFNNQLSGPIPKELGALSELKTLRLNHNQLAGHIPEELGALNKLQALRLNDNHLRGSIPDALGNLNELKRLWLHGNQLSGPIPKELGALSTLTELWLYNNQLTGLGEPEDALGLVERVGEGLALMNNPWIMPPEAVVEAGLQAVTRFLVDVRDAKKAGGDVTSLQLLKVVLVGSPSAGKTSLMQSIMAGRGCPTKGTSAQASTVGMELRPHQLQRTKVEFFDCAGQVDYAGMHQTFLTRRAVYLLVVDVTKYHDVEDLDSAAIRDDIMRWLYYLFLRAVGSTVILVANKCDGSIDDFLETSGRVRQRVGELLDVWHENRGLRGRSKGRVTDLNILPGMTRVSCNDKGSPDASGLPALSALISRQAATSILVPPAWDLALEVIGALRASYDPITAVRERLGLSNTPPTDGTGDVHAFAFISQDELSRKWRSVVDSIRGDPQALRMLNWVSALKGDWKSALTGALWISDFTGHTLRIDGGDGVFLDVLWLSKVLNPIVSHKLKDEIFAHEWTPMKRKLVSDKILRRQFAMHLWSESIDHVALQSEEIAGALFRTLIKLGVALPLGHTADGSSSDPQDMLVIMRLDERCDEETQREFGEYASEMQPGDREVTLKWKFDKAGPPCGLVERLIASCHVLGKVKSKACWRYGAVFKSHFRRSPVNGNGPLYAVALCMTSYDDPERELTARVVGPLHDARVWAAIRYVASAVVTFSQDWPGVLWEGWPVCAKRHDERVYLASSAELGGLLLPAAAPDAKQEEWCDCFLESSEVLALVLRQLGVVIDAGKDPFEGLPDDTEDAVACNCVHEAFDLWLPHAWVTARWLWGLVVALFFGAVVVGIVEDEDVLWKSCLAVAGLLLVLAVVASFFACGEQSQSGGQHGPPADNVAAFA